MSRMLAKLQRKSFENVANFKCLVTTLADNFAFTQKFRADEVEGHVVLFDPEYSGLSGMSENRKIK